jgi:stringent starvation protein B
MSKLPKKTDVFATLLLRGSVFVHLDPRKGNVVVPYHLRKQAQVVLQVGTNMAVPIPDLRVTEDGIHGSLNFKGKPFRCSMPWASIFALVGEDAKGMVWPEDMPKEVSDEIDHERETLANPKEVVDLAAFRKQRPAGSATIPTRKSDRPASERPSHLRVIK